MQTSWYRWEKTDLLLQVRVQPRASRDELAGVQGDRLRIRITAAPVDGKANAHLLRFLAELFGVSKSRVILMYGETGRNKALRIRSPRHLPSEIEPAPGRHTH